MWLCVCTWVLSWREDKRRRRKWISVESLASQLTFREMEWVGKLSVRFTLARGREEWWVDCWMSHAHIPLCNVNRDRKTREEGAWAMFTPTSFLIDPSNPVLPAPPGSNFGWTNTTWSYPLTFCVSWFFGIFFFFSSSLKVSCCLCQLISAKKSRRFLIWIPYRVELGCWSCLPYVLLLGSLFIRVNVFNSTYGDTRVLG